MRTDRSQTVHPSEGQPPGQQGSSAQVTTADGSSESIRSITPPCPGSRLPMSLTPRSRLISDSARSPPVAVTATAAPTIRPCHHWPPSSSQTVQRAADHRAEHRPGEALPGLLRRDRRRHRVFAEQHAGDIAAGVGATTMIRKVRIRCAPSAGHQHQGGETREQAQVDGDEDGGRDVGEVAGRALAEPPDQAGQRGQREPDALRGLPVGPGQGNGRRPTRRRPGSS